MLSFCIIIWGISSCMEAIQPETPELIRTSDLIAYVEIIKVAPVIEEGASEHLHPGSYRTFPAQKACGRILRSLKGAVAEGSDVVDVIKQENGFYLSQNERRVLYLKRKDGFYETSGILGGEHRLASAIWELRRAEEKGYGVVVGAKGNPAGLTAVVLRGRHSVPLIPESENWVQTVVKKAPVDELGVAEFLLESGSYTILLYKGAEVYHPNRLVNGFYPYVILDRESRWKIVYIQRGDDP